MAGQMSLMLRADPAGFNSGVDEAIQAIRNWEQVTDRSAEGAADSLEAAIRAVVKIGTEGKRSADDTKRALQGLGMSAEDAEDAFNAVQREAQKVGDSSRDIDKASDAVDDLGDGADDAAGKTEKISDAGNKVGDGLRDLGDIARDVLQGDFGSAAESAIGALSGLAGSLAGGAVGGAIASAVGGIVGDWVSSWKKAAEESEKRINTWADSFIEANGRALNESQILSEAQKILTDDTGRLATAQKIADSTGMSLADSVRALAGDQDALSEASSRTADALAANADAMADKSGSRQSMISDLVEQKRQLTEASDAIKQQSGEMDAAAGKAQVYADVLDNGASKLYQLATASGKATGEVDDLGNAIYELPDGKEVVVNAQTQKASEDLDAFEQRKLTAKTATLRLNIDDSAWRNYTPQQKRATILANVNFPGGTRQLLGG